MPSNYENNFAYWVVAIIFGSLINFGLFLYVPSLGKSSAPSSSVIKVHFMPWQAAEEKQQNKRKTVAKKATPKLPVVAKKAISKPAVIVKKVISKPEPIIKPVKQLALLREIDPLNEPKPPSGDLVQDQPTIKKPSMPVAIQKLASPPPFVLKVKPKYPFIMKFQGRTGKVELGVIIDAQGKVKDVTVLISAGTAFDNAAERALRASVFLPETKDGKPVSSSFTIPYKFELRQHDFLR